MKTYRITLIVTAANKKPDPEQWSWEKFIKENGGKVDLRHFIRSEEIK